MGKKRRKNSYQKPAPNSGRQKGVKNLKRVDGGFLNQEGVFFTAEEKKALESAVRKANKRSKKLDEIFNPLPYKIEGKETGMTVGQRRLTLGVELDFSIASKNASLQRYSSKEEYERYMKNLNRVNSKNYMVERARLYKRNYQTALTDPNSGLGLAYDDVSDILMKIRTMKPDEYIREVAMNEELTLHYIYDGSEGNIQQKLNSIRSALKLPHKELDSYWDGDDYK